jgi:hypothetical protein
MIVPYTRIVIIADATANGLVQGTDFVVKAGTNETSFVLALSMKGLKYLVYDKELQVPPEDLLILQCNLLASIAGKLTAWVQV